MPGSRVSRKVVSEREMGDLCSGPKICSEMHLLEFPDEYIIQPSDGGSHQALSICRSDGSLRLISFQSIQVSLKDSLVRVTLISRRCTRRIGTRMWRRGANLEGHVANFIETEQMLEVQGFVTSYLQVRGSIPVLWEQIVDLTYKPKLNLINTEETPKVLERHFLEQRYGSVLAIDLVNQSLLGQKSLDSQLQQIGLFSSSESISQYADFHGQFKILWANHGDEISLQYSGTHALKGDFVRYGRQTVAGFIKDGFNALARYYLNNFHDGIRQYLPIASALIVGGLTITTCSLQQVGRDAHHFLYSVVWAGLTAGVMAIVKANGRLFCCRPRLCKLY